MRFLGWPERFLGHFCLLAGFAVAVVSAEPLHELPKNVFTSDLKPVVDTETQIRKFAEAPQWQHTEIESFLKNLPRFAELEKSPEAALSARQRRLAEAGALLTPFLDTTFVSCLGSRVRFGRKESLHGTAQIVFDYSTKWFAASPHGGPNLEGTSGYSVELPFRPIKVGSDTLVLELPLSEAEKKEGVPIRRFIVAHFFSENGRKRARLVNAMLMHGRLVVERKEDLEESPILNCQRQWFERESITDLRLAPPKTEPAGPSFPRHAEVFRAKDKNEAQALASLDEFLRGFATAVPGELSGAVSKRARISERIEELKARGGALQKQSEAESLRSAEHVKSSRRLSDKEAALATDQAKVAKTRNELSSISKEMTEAVEKLRELVVSTGAPQPAIADVLSRKFWSEFRIPAAYFGKSTESGVKELRTQFEASAQSLLETVARKRARIVFLESELVDALASANKIAEQIKTLTAEKAATSEPRFDSRLNENEQAAVATEIAKLEKEHRALEQALLRASSVAAKSVGVPYVTLTRTPPTIAKKWVDWAAKKGGFEISSYELALRNPADLSPTARASLILMNDRQGKRSVWVVPGADRPEGFWLSSPIRRVESDETGRVTGASETLPLSSLVSGLHAMAAKLDAIDSGKIPLRSTTSFEKTRAFLKRHNLLSDEKLDALGDINLVYSPALARHLRPGVFAVSNMKPMIQAMTQSGLPEDLSRRVVESKLGKRFINTLYPIELIDKEFSDVIVHEVLHEIDLNDRAISGIEKYNSQQEALRKRFGSVLPELVRLERRSSSYKSAWKSYLERQFEGENELSPLDSSVREKALRENFENQYFGVNHAKFRASTEESWIYLNTPGEKAALAIQVAYLRDVEKLSFDGVLEKMKRASGKHSQQVDGLSDYWATHLREFYDDAALSKRLEAISAEAAELAKEAR